MASKNMKEHLFLTKQVRPITNGCPRKSLQLCQLTNLVVCEHTTCLIDPVGGCCWTILAPPSSAQADEKQYGAVFVRQAVLTVSDVLALLRLQLQIRASADLAASRVWDGRERPGRHLSWPSTIG